MNKLVMKKAIAVLPFLIAVGDAGTAMAYDSDTKDLGSTTGVTDYYKVTCTSGDTDHLNFKVTDTTPATLDGQQLKLQVSKGGSLLAEAQEITPGKTKEAFLEGASDGKYKILIDTVGTTVKGKQAYTLTAQCLNEAGQPTKSSLKSKSAKVKNGKRKSFVVKCSKKTATGNTAKLSVKLTNTTKSGAILSAQLVKGRVASNTTDGNEINLQGGGGDYYLTVDHTGTNGAANNSKQYTFQANCLNNASGVTAEPDVLQLQDQ